MDVKEMADKRKIIENLKRKRKEEKKRILYSLSCSFFSSQFVFSPYMPVVGICATI